MSRIKVGGAWKGPNDIFVKVAGAWRQSSESFVKVSGVWRRVTSLSPSIIGLTRTNANTAITNRGLVVGTQTATNTENSSIDQQIISSNPVANTPLDSGSSINYNYYQYVAPPFFPFFPPFFPFFPFFPPFFPFFPFFPPSFPFFPPQFGCSGGFVNCDAGTCCGGNLGECGYCLITDSCGNVIGCND